MPKTYYDSELTGAQIESALKAIHGVVTPSNNGKVLCIVNGAISAKSASEWGHGAVLEPLSVTANGDYTPPTGTDGFDSVHVAVPSATLTTKSITQNGTYNASQDNADGYSSVTVNVSGGGSAVIQSLNVTQNGTYNPPSGVDGYAPVTVNVSGGDTPPTGTLIYYQGTQYEALQAVMQSAAAVSINFDDAYINVHQISSANSGFAIYTQGKIDLTSYQKLKIKYFAIYTGVARYNPRFGCLENLPSSNPFDLYPNFTASDVLENSGYPIEVLELDISALSGNYYIGLSGFNTEAYITGIWLE